MVNRTSLSRVVPYPFCSDGNPTTLSIWSYFSFLSDTPHILKINRATNMSVSKNRISHMKFNSSRSHSELNPIQIIQTVSTSQTLFPPHMITKGHNHGCTSLQRRATSCQSASASVFLLKQQTDVNWEVCIYCNTTQYIGMIRFTINIYSIFIVTAHVHFVHVTSCKYKKYFCATETLLQNITQRTSGSNYHLPKALTAEIVNHLSIPTTKDDPPIFSIDSIQIYFTFRQIRNPHCSLSKKSALSHVTMTIISQNATQRKTVSISQVGSMNVMPLISYRSKCYIS